MIRYLLRRLLFALFLVVAVSSASFLLTAIAPGDFATGAAGDRAGQREVDALRIRLGLDRPVIEQYSQWLLHAARLDFGRSFQSELPVAILVPSRAANTALIAIAALLLATIVGLPLGVFTGTRRGGVIPGVVRTVSVLLLSMPPLLTSLLLVFVAARTGWLPIGGMTSRGANAGSTLDLLRHMVLPVLALALPIAAMFERLQSQAMQETLAQPFVLAARARGVPRARLVWRDALKAALRPVASIAGLVVGTLLSGSFAVEIVTAWPGIGRLMLNALQTRDLHVVAGCAVAGSLFLATGTLLADAAMAALDPRIADPAAVDGRTAE